MALGAAVSAGGTVTITLLELGMNPGLELANAITTVPPADTAAPNNLVST